MLDMEVRCAESGFAVQGAGRDGKLNMEIRLLVWSGAPCDFDSVRRQDGLSASKLEL